MELKIQEKLRKQKHLFDTFQKNPENMSFDCLIGNLCGRVLTEVEKNGMLPPIPQLTDKQMLIPGQNIFGWEDEDPLFTDETYEMQIKDDDEEK